MKKQNFVNFILKVWLKGLCDNKDCKFAHGSVELRHTDNLYKTSICKKFEKGLCDRGENCRYAHGVKELRKLETTSDSEEFLHPYKDLIKNNSKYLRKYIGRENNSCNNAYNRRKYSQLRYANIHNTVLSPSNFRYNYLNPFYIFTMSDFPIQSYGDMDQPMPFFNYTIIDNIVKKSETLSKNHTGMQSTQAESLNKSRQPGLLNFNTLNITQSKNNDTMPFE